MRRWVLYVAVLVVFGLSSSVCRGVVACVRWWLGGIATIGAALRRVVGVSGVYGRKTPRVVAWKGQGRVPVEGSMVAKPPAWLLKVQFTSVEWG